jgi:hypothetical protein
MSPTSSHTGTNQPQTYTTLHGNNTQEVSALTELVSEISEVELSQQSPSEHAQKHAAKILQSTLDHLRCNIQPSECLTDLAMVRIARASQPPIFEALDASALDAMVACGFDSRKVTASLRERAATIGQMHNAVVADTPIEIPQGLAQRTHAMIQATGTQPALDSMRLRVPLNRRLADVVSVAAMLLLCFSIGWPAMASWRSASMRAACSNNLRSVASAVGLYGGDFQDHLPAATAGFGGGQTWWNVGKGAEQSNSANLYTLTRTGYTGLEELACEGNPLATRHPHDQNAQDWGSLTEVSYSYRIITKLNAPLLGSAERFVVVTDRSPVVLRAVRNQAILPRENSFNHGGKGQHVLFSDGAVQWTTSPVLESGENFWLPRPLELAVQAFERLGTTQPLNGTEVPTSGNDDFVGP